AEAVDVARKADVVILAVGGNEQTAREAWSRGHMGDRTSLDLFGRQNDLVDALAATGKPIAALLFNGRPLAAARLSAQTDALLECWYLGQETGHAVADVLFGAVNPGGKLPISIPRSAGHVPAFYNHKPSARRGYLLDDVSPLYPFGFGLSYTTFEIRDVRLEHTEMTSAQMSSGQTTHVHAEITNTGRRAGSQVVQLYVRDEVSTVTRPVKELKGFERVHLEPGQTQTVSLAITPDDLAFFGLDLTFAVEPGTFAILVGTSSQDEDLHRVRLTITD
ncbi:MAG: glycoside hydrolase family 3 C-terminal domain-containing protein, partial [Bacteroidota bacterium]